jgi:hypothetical protein
MPRRFSLTHGNTYFELKLPGKLTALHWAGKSDQMNGSKAIGKSGWLCATGKTLRERKTSLVKSWINSKGENIFYDFFPDPVDNEMLFLSVPAIQGGAGCGAGRVPTKARRRANVGSLVLRSGSWGSGSCEGMTVRKAGRVQLSGL